MRKSSAPALPALLLVLVLVSAPDPGPVMAQDAAARIAIVDVQRIYREAEAAKALQSELDASRRSIEGDLRLREQALRQADLALRQARGSLTEAEIQSRSQALARDAADLEREARERGQALDRRSKEGFDRIRAALLTVVGRIAETRNLDMVLTTQAMVLQSSALDLTGEALAQLDEALPLVSPGSPEIEAPSDP